MYFGRIKNKKSDSLLDKAMITCDDDTVKKSSVPSGSSLIDRIMSSFVSRDLR